MRSMTFLSISVCSPKISSSTCLPLCLARSRTTRLKRLKMVATGSMRTFITASCRLRAVRARESVFCSSSTMTGDFP